MYKIFIENDSNTEQGNLLDGMDNVSTKIKALPKDQINKASAEIEKGEYVMNPNTLSLHKALGKKHSKGGTPVNIPENTFIFSNFKDLGFNKNDEERFEFKLGGTKLKYNTPAKIIEKNVDVKHHNKMINIMSSYSQDDIAKNSAQLMLTKNLDTIGKIAYVQEGKKGFPQGIPPFSNGTAPIYAKDVDDNITQSVQYMKHGGSVIPKYQLGKSTYNDRQKFWQDQGQLMLYPEIQWNGTQHASNGLFDKASDIEFRKRNPWFFTNHPNANMRNPNDVKLFQSEYNKMYADEFNGEQYFTGSNDMGVDGKFGNHTYNAPAFIHKSYATANSWDDFNDPNNVGDSMSTNAPIVNRKILSYTPGKTQGLDYSRPQEGTFPNSQVFGLPVQNQPIDYTRPSEPIGVGSLNAGEVNDFYTNQYKPVGFTPWQKFNMALPLLNKASIKSQYPLYQQQRSVTPELSLLSADAQLNQIGMDYNQASSLNNILNPIQASANNSELYGKKLDASNQIFSQTNQANNQILNQQNTLNAQSFNNDMMNNLKFNKQYYDELATTEQNKQRYKDYYNTQFITNANEMITENQAFNNMLGTQQTYDGKPLYTPVSNGFGYSMQLTPGVNPDILFNQAFGSKGNMSNIVSSLDQRIKDAEERGDYRAVASLEETKARYVLSQKKLGGFIPKFKL